MRATKNLFLICTRHQSVLFMDTIIIKNVHLVNEGTITIKDVLIQGQRISKISEVIDNRYNAREIDGSGKYLFPGVIDDQVHFREPTHPQSQYSH